MSVDHRQEYSARIVPLPRADGAARPEPVLTFPRGGATLDVVVSSDASGDLRREWYARAGTEADLRSMTEAITAGWPGVDIRPPGDGDDPGRILAHDRRIVLALRPRGGEAVPVAALAAPAAGESNAPLAEASPGPGARIIVRMTGRSAGGRASLPEPATDDLEGPRSPHVLVGDPQFLLISLLGFLLLLGFGLGVIDPVGGTLDFTPLRLTGDSVWLEGAPYAALAIAGVAAWLRVRRSRSFRRWRPTPLSEEDLAVKRESMLMHVSSLIIGVPAPDTSRGDLRRAVYRVGHACLQRAGPEWELHEVRFGRAGFRPSRGGRACLSAREAGALFPGPAPVAPESGIEHVGARRRSPTPGHAARGALIGRSDADPTREIRQPMEVQTRHQLIAGKSGAGKSTLLRDLAVGAMDASPEGSGRAGSTVIIVDPHSDLANAVLRAIPTTIKDRVLHIDFGGTTHLPSLNLLDVHLYPDVPRQVDRVVAVLKLAYPGPEWGPRMQQILRRSVTALMNHNLRLPRGQQHSLLDVLRFISDGNYRDRVFEACDDELRRWEWAQAYDHLPRGRWEEWRQPVDNKLTPLRDHPLAAHILGQPVSTIDLAEMLRGGVDYVIVDGGSAMLGNESAQLVCSSFVNALLQSVMSADTPPEVSRGITLIVDEAAVLSAIDYETAYAQGRKYGVAIVAATQSPAQIDRIDPQLMTIIGTNVGAHIVFGTGEEDAGHLARELGVPAREIVSLDDYRAIARWTEQAAKGQAFTFTTLPPRAPAPDADLIADYIRERSRELYCTPVERGSGRRPTPPGRP